MVSDLFYIIEILKKLIFNTEGVDVISEFGTTFSAIFVDEKDMSMLTIRAVEDPRTLDKILHVRPPANMRSFGQLLHLLEKKTGRTFERHYVTEQELAKKIQGSFLSIHPYMVASYI